MRKRRRGKVSFPSGNAASEKGLSISLYSPGSVAGSYLLAVLSRQIVPSTQGGLHLLSRRDGHVHNFTHLVKLEGLILTQT